MFNRSIAAIQWTLDSLLQKSVRRPLSKLAAGALVLCLIFGQVSAAHAQSLIRDAELETYLREMADPIFATAGLEPENVHLYIVNDSSLNAFVAGGQNMFIHTGLLQRVEEPGQIAGVIAHETGHIAGGHLARLPDALKAASAAMILSYILGTAALIAGAGDAGIAILAGGQSAAQRAVLSYSRSQESAADQAGLRFLEGAEESARGFAGFMEILADQEALSSRRQDPYVRSHPLSRERVSALNAGAKASPYYEQQPTEAEMHKLKMLQAKLKGFLDKPAAVFRAFPPKDKSLPARYARAVAYHRTADIGNAIEELKVLTEAEPDNPYFAELAGQVLFESGLIEESIPAHRTAVELAPEQPLLKINLAQSLIAAERPDYDEEARELLDAALRQEKDIPLAWHQLAIVHARNNDPGMASLASAERYALVGAMGLAMQQAQRALNFLPAGSPGALRAEDIIAEIRYVASQNR